MIIYSKPLKAQHALKMYTAEVPTMSNSIPQNNYLYKFNIDTEIPDNVIAPGSPEYNRARRDGNLVTYDPNTGTYVAAYSLPEVTVVAPDLRIAKAVNNRINKTGKEMFEAADWTARMNPWYNLGRTAMGSYFAINRGDYGWTGANGKPGLVQELVNGTMGDLAFGLAGKGITAGTKAVTKAVAPKLYSYLGNKAAKIAGDIANNVYTTAGTSSSFPLFSNIRSKFKKPFKSEIDWGAWNREIPENVKLMEEYAQIEKAAKKNGTWMKNSDGTEFWGTPEQFVQVNSENFKKAFPEYERVFRGYFKNEFNPTLKPRDKDLGPAIFTADEYVADSYGDELLELAHRRSNNSIKYTGNEDNWTNLHLGRPAHYYEDKIKNIDKLIKEAQELKKQAIKHGRAEAPHGAMESPEGFDFIIGRYQRQKDNLMKFLDIQKTLSPKEYNNLRGIRLRATQGTDKLYTDDLARYIEQKGIDYAQLKNISDGFVGDVTIVNHVPGNYLKSLKNNNGMFDMTNPNIYKILTGVTLGGGILHKYNSNNKITQ